MTPRYSTDLATWMDLPASLVVENIDGTFTATLPDEPRAFLKLEIETIPPDGV